MTYKFHKIPAFISHKAVLIMTRILSFQAPAKTHLYLRALVKAAQHGWPALVQAVSICFLYVDLLI